MNNHTYEVNVEWTGNLGMGTSDYREYSRNHVITAGGKEALKASSDPAFRGDTDRYNPEELLVASISSCHMLWFLHLCADAGVIVETYKDNPVGKMEEGDKNAPGRFLEVKLRPQVGLQEEKDRAKLQSLHDAAHKRCFISNSVNFPVFIEQAREEAGV